MNNKPEWQQTLDSIQDDDTKIARLILLLSMPVESHEAIKYLISQAKKQGREEALDVAEDLWGLVCNVNGGNLGKETLEWHSAFTRIRKKYLKILSKLTKNNE